MSARMLILGISILGILVAQAPAQEIVDPRPVERGTFLLGFSTSGVHYRLKKDGYIEAAQIPFMWLSVPHLTYILTRLTIECLLAEQAVQDAQNVNSAEAEPAGEELEHLFAIAQRCERTGDIDMARNCYTEITRLRPNCTLAAMAMIHCRRLQSVEQRRKTPTLDNNTQRTSGN